VDGGITVDLAGGRLQDLRLKPLGQPQHVDRAVDGRLRRLHGIALVVDGRCRTREIVDFIDLDVERKGHIVPDQLEALVPDQILDIAPCACEKIIHA
jgi:hypothetical protein